MHLAAFPWIPAFAGMTRFFGVTCFFLSLTRMGSGLSLTPAVDLLTIHLVESGVKIVYYHKMRNMRQLIEYFHLIFLDRLGRKIDKRLYTLKGGCNLRFYFQSFRYSEDIDFDIQIINS